MYVYLTADRIGETTGGGIVTAQESLALRELAQRDGADCLVIGRDDLEAVEDDSPDPWTWDHRALKFLQSQNEPITLLHCYAGTFSETVHWAKRNGVKVTYTCAAHDKEESRKEYATVGVGFDYPHLIDPDLWRRYLAGYLEADVCITPSTYSQKIVEGYGHKNVVVVPHGVHFPQAGDVGPAPKKFTVGYLGAYGPDKGVRYLLDAWGRFSKDHPDSLLLLGGRQSTHGWVVEENRKHGGNVCFLGFVKDLTRDFYNLISVYVQPSVSEGFGIEVLEARVHHRPVICSEGAGAADCVPEEWRFKPRDVPALTELLGRCDGKLLEDHWMPLAYEWSHVRELYKDFWGT